MCNRYRLSEKGVALAKHFGLVIPPDFSWPAPELFPKREGVVVRRDEGTLIIDKMTWGFPPPAAGRAPVTNVRSLSSPF